MTMVFVFLIVKIPDVVFKVWYCISAFLFW